MCLLLFNIGVLYFIEAPLSCEAVPSGSFCISHHLAWTHTLCSSCSTCTRRNVGPKRVSCFWAPRGQVWLLSPGPPSLCHDDGLTDVELLQGRKAWRGCSWAEWEHWRAWWRPRRWKRSFRPEPTASLYQLPEWRMVNGGFFQETRDVLGRQWALWVDAIFLASLAGCLCS